MTTDIQKIIDSAKLVSEVRVEGEIDLEMPKSTSFYVGKNFSKSLITITKPNITLDFSDAIVRMNITEPLDTDLNIFFVSSMAKSVEIKNLKLYVYLNIPATARQIVGLYLSKYYVDLRVFRFSSRIPHPILYFAFLYIAIIFFVALQR